MSLIEKNKYSETVKDLEEGVLGNIVTGIAKYAIRKSVYGRPITVNNTTPEANKTTSSQNSQNDYLNNL